jgi:hypothetical protein
MYPYQWKQLPGENRKNCLSSLKTKQFGKTLKLLTVNNIETHA